MIEFIGNARMGERLKLLRGSRTLSEVAEACDITVSALANYEAGARVPRDEVKARIANYYSTTVNELFFYNCDTHDM